MLASFSVRAYNLMLRDKIDMDSAEAVLAYADKVRAKKVRNAGRKTCVELYRAVGLGLYSIADKMNYDMDFRYLKKYCEYLDRYTFHRAG